MKTATSIQTRHGRTLYFDGERFIMNGPTGTHSLAASETCFERLAAHWSGFSGSKNDDKFLLNLKKAIVRSFVRRDISPSSEVITESKATVQLYFGADSQCGRRALASISGVEWRDQDTNVIGYASEVDWHSLGIRYSSPVSGCDQSLSSKHDAHAASWNHLVQHILEIIASDKITLAQIVGAQA